MDFRDMSYVLAIARYGSITKAANALYIGQPTLTKFLQKLEKDLNQRLFDRLGNQFIPTYAGERYIEKASAILNLKDELDHELHDIINEHVGVLKIAFPNMRGTNMMPSTIPVFRKMYPHVQLSIYEGNSMDLEQRLLTGEVDLAFFNLPAISPNLDYEMISREEILVMVPADNPLCKKGVVKPGCRHPWIDFSLFQDELFVLQDPEQRTRQTEDSLFRQFGFEPRVLLVTQNVQAACLLVAKGQGVCLVNESHIKNIPFEQTPMVFSIGNPCTTVDFVAAFRKGRYLPQHAKDYIKIVREYC